MKRGFLICICVLVLGIASPFDAAAQNAEHQTDMWAALRSLQGQWQGQSAGQPGEGSVVRQYEFILSERFLHERNTSTYPPQEKNKKGEVHQHWSLFSFDKKRKTIIFRQFHQESFVVTYALNSALSSARKWVFESEQMENVPSTWKARETYELISENEFVETFELAQDGQSFAVYSRAQFQRAQ
ncbi:MAG: hypothetical protein HY253_12755 [Burkholderiales bacterium]|nr:hypothetical protein [Burkholderiales bacterium]